MMGYGYGMMGYGWGWFIMIGAVVLTVLGIVALINYFQLSTKTNGRSNNNALNILNERYARGEITEEEYNQKKTQLRK
ncbi:MULTISPECIES: SHOCT domain-containing protein [unclassified Sedimentibacter]|uniref:SHOCT domain-containing protein n=1 Tax=unclassified Sedimentibacter TaxID=2649220 RepID=UPI0027E120F4|nr:SHOCT domain-containing protein [Sedimentibacter sp. MB35-C1]WMJ77783.1 SHOCT domain-containing protein [Sedimentibacter sp. MB35-C1]